MKFCLICTFLLTFIWYQSTLKKKLAMALARLAVLLKMDPADWGFFWLPVVPIMKAIFGAPRLPAARQSWPLASVACGVSDGGCANLAPQGSDRSYGAVPTSARLPLQPRPKMLNQKRHSPHLLPAWKREPVGACCAPWRLDRMARIGPASCGAKMICIFERVIEVSDACECAPA